MSRSRWLPGFVVFISLALVSCSLWSKKHAKTALDVVDTLCILSHPEKDVALIRQLCAIEEVFSPDIHKVLASPQAAAMRQAGRPAASGPIPAASSSCVR